MLPKYLMTMIFLCLFVRPIYTQNLNEIRLIKILDANLFLAENGQWVVLANVQSPSINSEDSMLAKKIMEYADNFMVRIQLKYRLEKANPENDTIHVHLYRKFPLTTICFNEKYLKRGFGKYQKTEQEPINESYKAAEQEARQKNKGVWGVNQSYYPAWNTFIFKCSENVKTDKYAEPTSFRNFTYQRLGTSMAFELSLSRKYTYYGGIENDKSDNFLIIPKMSHLEKYYAFSYGIIFYKELEGSEFGSFVAPKGSFSIGYLPMISAHVEFLNEDLFSIWNYGIRFKFADPYGEISIGNLINSNGLAQYIILRFDVLNKLIFEFQGKYDFEEEYGFFIMGLGFTFLK